MNVYENMAFGLEMRKFSKVEINRRVQEAAEILNIGHLLERKPKALSGGQRQRVALGRAIVREPKVFLMDEPLSNLDAKLRVQMRAELTKLHQRLQTTFIYVTHDQTEAMTMGDRIVVMKDGYIQQVDTPLNLYKYPNNVFVAGFVGLPSMNFFSVEVVEEAGSLWLTNPCCRIAVSACHRSILAPYIGKEIVLGIRPEIFSDDPHFLASHEAWVSDVKIDIVEHMGAETNVYFPFGGVNVIARLNNSTLATPHQHHKIAFDMEAACFFDACTQEVIN
jgi:multiple sugar transport system ATP-binding protein